VLRIVETVSGIPTMNNGGSTIVTGTNHRQVAMWHQRVEAGTPIDLGSMEETMV
jgi:hypothetical protein